MAKTNKETIERVKPLVITVTNKEGDAEEYTLEFDRDAIRFAESRGFKPGELDVYPMTRIPELWFYSFRMHHKNVSREKTDKILFEGFGGITGIPAGVIKRLGELYSAPFEAMQESKNCTVTVEL